MVSIGRFARSSEFLYGGFDSIEPLEFVGSGWGPFWMIAAGPEALTAGPAFSLGTANYALAAPQSALAEADPSVGNMLFTVEAMPQVAAAATAIEAVALSDESATLGTARDAKVETFEVTASDARFALNATNLALLAELAPTADWSKLQFGLAELFVESQVTTASLPDADRAVALAGFKSSNELVRTGGGMIGVDFTAANGDGAALLDQLTALGLQKGAAYGAMASGLLPIDALDDLASLKSLAFARPVLAMTNVGTVTSQDSASMYADTTRAAFGVNGAGITVGVLSDSFDTLVGGLTNYARDVMTGDLPANVAILKDFANGSDEGRAMAQLIYDVAPGVNLAFHTAFGGQADFANGIRLLAQTAQIVVDDVFYFAEPFFQDGIIAQAVDAAAGRGTMYFSSAGNSGSQSYESAYRASTTTVNISNAGVSTNYTYHDFDPGAGVDTLQRVTVGANARISFQWDQPFKSAAPTSTGSQNDMALIIFNTMGQAVAVVNANNINGDPVEIAGLTAGGQYDIGLLLRTADVTAGRLPGLMKYINFGSGYTANEFGTNSGASVGHSAANGAVAVAAIDWSKTPAYGVTPGLSENFSSKGGTPILFDVNGNRLAAPEIRDKVEITAPDGGNTTFFFSDSASDADTFPNFFGTSAAAPNAAAAAALIKQGVPGASNAQIEQAFKDTAMDIVRDEDGILVGVGFDRTTGFGLINAFEAYTLLAGGPFFRSTVLLTDADGDTVADPGDTLRTTLRIANTTTTDYTNVVVTDQLNGSTAPQTINVGTVAAGTTVTITYDSTVAAFSNQIIPTPFTNAAVVQYTTAGTTLSPTSNAELLIVDTLTLGNILFRETARNGIRESGELGIDGVTVELFVDANNDDVPDGAAIASRVTFSGGGYTFTGLAPGNYIVSVNLAQPALAGLSLSTTGLDPDDNINNDNNGVAGPAGTVVTKSLTLSYNSEPVNDADIDNDTNLSVDIAFFAPNQAEPIVGLNGDAVTYTEDAPFVLLDAGGNASVTQIDTGNFNTGSLTVAITGGLVAAEDRLGIAAVNGVSLSGTTVVVNGVSIGTVTGGGAGGGNLVITFNTGATAATVTQLLRALSYTNSNTASPATPTRTITYTLVDGDGVAEGGVDTSTAMSTVNVVSVNDRPSLLGLTTPVTFAENLVNTSPQLLDPDVTFTDAEGNLAGGNLTVSGLLAEDRLAIRNEGTAPGQIGVAGSTITFGGVTIGTFTGGVGTTLVVSFTADATAVAVDALIQNLTYQNVSDTPTFTRLLTFNVTDATGAGLLSVPTFVTLTAAANPFNTFDVGTYSAPNFVDIDGDGDLDAIIGAQDGTLFAFRNNGALAAFTPLTGTANPFNGVDVGTYAAPSFVDLDGDGDRDAVVGAQDGTLLAFRNNGPNTAFTALAGAANPFTGIDVGSYATPSFVDLDGDGDLDAVVGNSAGTLLAFRNDGLGTPFTALAGTANPFNGIDVGSYSAPGFVDLDGDGDRDAVIGNQAGTLLGYRNNGPNTAFTALVTTENPFNGINFGTFSTPGFGDLDGDGDDDAVVGEQDGTLNTLRNNAPPLAIRVNVTPDAPVGTVPATATVGENEVLVFSAANGTAISVADADGGGNVVQVTVSTADGNLILASAVGVTVTGNDTNSVTLSGTVTAINTALDGLLYAPAIKTSGSRTITVTVTEPGVGGGGTAPLTDTDAIAVTITPVSYTFATVSNPAGGTLTGTAAANDFLVGGEGPDTLDAGDAGSGGRHDRLFGQGGDDLLRPGRGRDIIYGDAGSDTADYSQAAGAIVAVLGNSFVHETRFTGSGTVGAADVTSLGDFVYTVENLIGSAFGDRLEGDAGNNVIAPGAGNDIAYGLGGVNTISYAAATGAVLADLGASTVHETGATTGTIADASGAVSIDYVYGFQNLVGSSFGDRLYGTAGDNVLTPGAGADIVYGQGGNDTVDYSNAAGAVFVDLAAFTAYESNLTTGTIVSGNGAVSIDYLYGIANVTGSAFGDRLYGTAGVNTLNGGAGDDILYALDADDILNGGTGNDQLIGNNGNDTLTGGLGNDRFYFVNMGEGVDTVTDFVSADDDLYFSSANFASNTLRMSGETGSGPAFFYNQATGALSYSVSGVEGAGTLLANLGAGTALTQADIVLYT